MGAAFAKNYQTIGLNIQHYSVIQNPKNLF